MEIPETPTLAATAASTASVELSPEDAQALRTAQRAVVSAKIALELETTRRQATFIDAQARQRELVMRLADTYDFREDEVDLSLRGQTLVLTPRR